MIMIWVTGRSPTLVSHSLRGVAMNLKATTLTYLAITPRLARKDTDSGETCGGGTVPHERLNPKRGRAPRRDRDKG